MVSFHVATIPPLWPRLGGGGHRRCRGRWGEGPTPAERCRPNHQPSLWSRRSEPSWRRSWRRSPPLRPIEGDAALSCRVPPMDGILLVSLVPTTLTGPAYTPDCFSNRKVFSVLMLEMSWTISRSQEHTVHGAKAQLPTCCPEGALAPIQAKPYQFSSAMPWGIFSSLLVPSISWLIVIELNRIQIS
jgi:hypothetical protein